VIVVSAVVGGWNKGSGALSSAELYDPKTGTFGPTGSMAAPHALPTATLLLDAVEKLVTSGTGPWASLLAACNAASVTIDD